MAISFYSFGLFITNSRKFGKKVIHFDLCFLFHRSVVRNKLFFSDFYRQKVDTLDKELAEKSTSLTETQALSEKKDRRISTLELQLKAQEKKFTDMVREKDQQIRQLKMDVADKASVNAELMLKRLSQSQDNATMIRVTAAPVDQDLSASTPDMKRSSAHSPAPPKTPLAPHPPKEGTAIRVRRRTSPRAVVVEGEPKLASKVKPRGASGRMLRRSGTPETITPDPTPFLQPRENSPRDASLASASKHAKPLPPITRRSQRMRDSAEGPPVTPRQTESYAFVPKPKAVRQHAKGVDHSSGSSSPEVEVLAVDAVVKRNHKLRRAQEYNADCK